VEDQYFAVFEGKMVSNEEKEKFDFNKSRYTVKLGSDYIDGTDPYISEISRINDYHHAIHKKTGKSATPNCVMVQRTVNGKTSMCLRASRYISKDEEYFYKYDWPFATWSRVEAEQLEEKKRIDNIASMKYSKLLENYLSSESSTRKRKNNQVISEVVATVDSFSVYNTDLQKLNPGMRITDNVRFVLYISSLIIVCHMCVLIRL